MRLKGHNAKGLAAAATFLLCLGNPSAGVAETYAFESLRYPLTAEQTVWGGLSASASDGAAMLRANPAGLAENSRPAFSSSYQAWQFGLRQHWAAGILPLRPVTVAAEIAAVHAGSLPSYDAEGNRLGSFTPAELVVGVGLQRAVYEWVSIGAAAHALRLTGAGDEMSGLALRFGALIRLLGTRFGACLRNLGKEIEGTTGSYALPAELSLGVERRLWSGPTLSFGATVDRNHEACFHGGSRWVAPGGVAVLAGAAYRDGQYDRPFSPRAGAALDLRAFSVSYGYVPDSELGATHHLSLHFPGDRGRPADAPGSLDAPVSVGPHVRAVGDVAANEPLSSWSVWGGTYRTEAGAQSEVRALRVQQIDDPEVTRTPDGLFRVRIAGSLGEAEARRLARLLRATCSED